MAAQRERSETRVDEHTKGTPEEEAVSGGRGVGGAGEMRRRG